MTSPNKVSVGDLMCFPYWGEVEVVTSYRGDKVLTVKGLDDRRFEIHGNPLIEKAFSADQYEEVKKVTKSEIAQILVDSFNVPFTVCFVKADGSDRVLRGRLLRHEALMGRSYVEDLDIDGHNLRQVDHRNIKYLIVNNIRYVTK